MRSASIVLQNTPFPPHSEAKFVSLGENSEHNSTYRLQTSYNHLSLLNIYFLYTLTWHNSIYIIICTRNY